MDAILRLLADGILSLRQQEAERTGVVKPGKLAQWDEEDVSFIIGTTFMSFSDSDIAFLAGKHTFGKPKRDRVAPKTAREALEEIATQALYTATKERYEYYQRQR